MQAFFPLRFLHSLAKQTKDMPAKIRQHLCSVQACEGLAVPWVSLGKPQCRAAHKAAPRSWEWGCRGPLIHLIQARFCAPSCLGAMQLHAPARRDSFLCRAQGWGWEGAGSRRWGWCDVLLIKQLLRAGGEEAHGWGGLVMRDVYKFRGGYLRIFILSSIHSCPWNEYQSISIQGSLLPLQQPALIPFLPRDPCVTRVGVCTKEWTRNLAIQITDFHVPRENCW